MMKKTKVIDERQEQALLKSESGGFWLAFWLLLAVMLVQVVVTCIDINIFIPNFAGEWLVFMVLCVYMLSSCLKNNIWAKNHEPSLKSNLIYSLIAGVVMAIIAFIVIYVNSGRFGNSFIGAAIMGVFVFGMCIALLSVVAASYKRKKKSLEETDE